MEKRRINVSGFYLSNNTYTPAVLDKKANHLRCRGRNIKTISEEDMVFISSVHNKESNITHCNDLYILLDGTIYNKNDYSDDFYFSNDEDFLICMYRKYSYSMLTKLNGDFAFVIIDRKNKTVFGARDRLGKKPLFYSNVLGFECSSSLKSLHCDKTIKINDRAEKMYMKFGFIYDTECIFEGTYKLQAAHYFVYDLVARHISVQKYWDINEQNEHQVLDKQNTIDRLDYLIDDAIKRRIQKDSIIGMGISAGVDSFSIFNYLCMNEIDPALFNIVPKFSSESYNEYPIALEHVHSVRPEKDINVCKLSDADCYTGLYNYFSLYDEPNSDFSCIITNLLFSNMRAKGITLAFSGIGADDILFGKISYFSYLNDISSYSVSSSVLGKYIIDSTDIDDFRNNLVSNEPVSMQRYDINTYLCNLLVKEDIASQANGIDIRTPFCDYRIVEFTNSIPLDILYYDGQLKYLLKKIVLDKFHVNLFNQPKHGFAPDIKEILKIAAIREDIKKNLTNEIMQYLFPEISYEDVENAFNKSTTSNSNFILNLYLYTKMIMNYAKYEVIHH